MSIGNQIEQLSASSLQFQVLQNMNFPCNNNIRDIAAMEDRLKDVLISNAETIKNHTTVQSEVVQHSLSETEKNLENSIKHGVNELTESHAASLQIVRNQLDAARSDIREVNERQGKFIWYIWYIVYHTSI